MTPSQTARAAAFVGKARSTTGTKPYQVSFVRHEWKPADLVEVSCSGKSVPGEWLWGVECFSPCLTVSIYDTAESGFLDRVDWSVSIVYTMGDREQFTHYSVLDIVQRYWSALCIHILVVHSRSAVNQYMFEARPPAMKLPIPGDISQLVPSHFLNIRLKISKPDPSVLLIQITHLQTLQQNNFDKWN